MCGHRDHVIRQDKYIVFGHTIHSVINPRKIVQFWDSMLKKIFSNGAGTWGSIEKFLWYLLIKKLHTYVHIFHCHR